MSAVKQKLAAVPEQPFEPNPLAVIGSNSGPMEVEPTPYEKAKRRIEDLFGEAKLWLDGAVVDSKELADGLKNIRDEVNKAHKVADDARKAENAEFDKGKTEVQERYNLLIGKTTKVTGTTHKILAALDKAVEPWLVAEDKRIRAESAEKRRIADEAIAAAQEALRASDPSNLAEREEAEELVSGAKSLERDANRAEKTTAKVSGDFGNRAISLRKVYTATFNPPSADGTVKDGRTIAFLHFQKTKPAEIANFLQSLANEHIRFGDHSPDELPGFTITHEMKL